MFTPKLRIVDRPSKDNEQIGMLKIIYYDRSLHKYKWVSARYGKRQSKEKAMEVMTKRQEELKMKLTYDGPDRVYPDA